MRLPSDFSIVKNIGIIFTRGLVTKPTRASRCQRPANFFDRLDAEAENSNSKRAASLFDSGLPEPPVGNLLLSVQTCFPRRRET